MELAGLLSRTDMPAYSPCSLSSLLVPSPPSPSALPFPPWYDVSTSNLAAGLNSGSEICWRRMKSGLWGARGSQMHSTRRLCLGYCSCCAINRYSLDPLWSLCVLGTWLEDEQISAILVTNDIIVKIRVITGRTFLKSDDVLYGPWGLMKPRYPVVCHTAIYILICISRAKLVALS